MKITAYIHPIRTYLPCTGAGRFINNSLLTLAEQPDVDIELLFSSQWLAADGKLDPTCPLRDLPHRTFPMPENRTERQWKLLGHPRMDDFVADETDWLFAPVATYIPVTKVPIAVTIFDIQAFEPHLSWSRSWGHRWFRYKWERWIRRAFATSRLILTISEFSKQRMVDLLGADPHKIEVVGCGVEPAFFEVAAIDPAQIVRPVEAPYSLVIGGLRQKKGGDAVLEVAQRLQQQGSNLQIVVAGASEAAYIEAAEAYSNITLLGLVSDDALPILLRGASSLLFLSLYEGFGIPAVEAMAAGVPSIVSNNASFPEVVGDAALMVDPEAVDDATEMLLNVESDPHLRELYIQRGQERAAQYTWANCAGRILDVFEQFA